MKEIEYYIEQESTNYIDWDELRYGRRENSGSKEALAFIDGARFAVNKLKELGLLKEEYTTEED